MSRRIGLILILLFILAVGIVGSMATYFAWFDIEDESNAIHVGLVLPGGENGPYTETVRQGAQLFLDEVNNDKFFKSRRAKLLIADSDSASVAQLLQQPELLAILGHRATEDVNGVADRYREESLAVISPFALSHDLLQQHDWLYSTAINPLQQVGFLANYTRNVLGHKVVTTILPDTAIGRELAARFEAIYNRFGTKIHYQFSYAADGGVRVVRLRSISSLPTLKISAIWG